MIKKSVQMLRTALYFPLEKSGPMPYKVILWYLRQVARIDPPLRRFLLKPER